MTNMEEILAKVQEYISEKNASKKWTPGVDTVQYAGPYFDHREYTAAIESLLGGWLVLGKDAQKFEHRFPQKFGKSYGVLTNSGSSSNLIQMNALRSKRLWNLPVGTKVITPIAGFPTTVNPIFQVGFVPIWVDIELDSLNLNIDHVERALEEHPDCRVITFAHVLGNPPNMHRIMEIVKKHDLILLEDCCDALGSTYYGMPLGSFGEMASCSFYPAHHITGGEGGFVSTKTEEQEKVVRSFREWGRGCYCVGQRANLLKNGTCGCRFKEWVPAMPGEIFDHKYVYDEIGYNLKPIELQASMLLVQMEKLDEIGEARRRNHSLLMSAFAPFEEFFVLPQATKHSDPNWFAFAVTIRDSAPFKRTQIVDWFESHKIQTRPYFAGNIMLQPAYDHLVDPNQIAVSYPTATKVMKDTFFLGTSPVITAEQISYVSQVLADGIKKLTSGS
jgi:CDP-6-deoxy-D-xylo-4-hexulose-3-dehydrase